MSDDAVERAVLQQVLAGYWDCVRQEHLSVWPVTGAVSQEHLSVWPVTGAVSGKDILWPVTGAVSQEHLSVWPVTTRTSLRVAGLQLCKHVDVHPVVSSPLG